MLARLSLGILFAVLVAASRPTASGGAHDLLAVGVRVEETGPDGKVATRLVLGVPEGKALAAYESLIRSPAKDALLQGTTVYAPAPEKPLEGRRIVEFLYYGHGSRAGRSPVVFTAAPEASLPGAAEAYAAAVELSSMPGPVTAAAAKVLLASGDLASYADALEALSAAQADAASAEAVATAADPRASPERRVVAIRALRDRLGGARNYPRLFRDLAADASHLVRDAAK
jgi:hypothetical protein